LKTRWKLTSRVNKKGSAVVDVVVAATMIVFVVFPVFSFVMEKYILEEKARMIRDAVDMTNISVYNALTTADLGKASVDLRPSDAMDIFEVLLCSNLNLSPGLIPKDNSIAEGAVEVISLEIYTEAFPTQCSNQTVITRPSVHSVVKVPIKPAMYRAVIMELLGKEFIDLVVHVDSEIPVNK
jgi:hypothetical protein